MAIFTVAHCTGKKQVDHKPLEEIDKSKIKLFSTMMLLGLQLYCIEHGDTSFPLDKRKELAEKIKNKINQMTNNLLRKDAKEFKNLGLALLDYESTLKEGQFSLKFNKSLAKATIYYYRKLTLKDLGPLDTKYMTEDQYRYITTITSVLDDYFDVRRNSNSLHKISRGIGSILESIKVEGTTADEKILAVQEALRRSGEYLKGTKDTPNLDYKLGTELTMEGIPVLNLITFRDTLTHKHLFPLIENETVDKISGDLTFVRYIIDNEIDKLKSEFISRIIDQNFRKIEVFNASFKDILSIKMPDKSIPDIITALESIKEGNSYMDLTNNEKALIDEIYENAKQIVNPGFPRRETNNSEFIRFIIDQNFGKIQDKAFKNIVKHNDKLNLTDEKKSIRGIISALESIKKENSYMSLRKTDKSLIDEIYENAKQIVNPGFPQSETNNSEFIRFIIDQNFGKIQDESFKNIVKNDRSLNMTDKNKSIPDIISALELIKRENSYKSLTNNDKALMDGIYENVKQIVNPGFPQRETINSEFIRFIIDQNFGKIQDKAFKNIVKNNDKLSLTDEKKSIRGIISALESIKKENSYMSLRKTDKSLIDEIYENAKQIVNPGFPQSETNNSEFIRFIIDQNFGKIQDESFKNIVKNDRSLNMRDKNKSIPDIISALELIKRENSYKSLTNNDKALMDRIYENVKQINLHHFPSRETNNSNKPVKKYWTSSLAEATKNSNTIEKLRKKVGTDVIKNVKGVESKAIQILFDGIIEGIDGKPRNNQPLQLALEQYLLNKRVQKSDAAKAIKHLENFYSKKIKSEFSLLKTLKNDYAIWSQILNLYDVVQRHDDLVNTRSKYQWKAARMRNYLSHGSTLVTIEEDTAFTKDFAKLVREALIGELENVEDITMETIEQAIESVITKDGVTLPKEVLEVLGRVRVLICGDTGLSRRRRSVKSCLEWKEIDKFNKRGAANRDPDNIIIDSKKFIETISNERGANKEKFSNFIALASESEVIGDYKDKVNMLTDTHMYLGHLERVGKVSGMVMHGMIAKNMIADLFRGDYEDLAINTVFLAGNQGLAKLAETVSMKGAGYMLEGRALLGKSLKFASPFLARGVSAFIAYDLYNQVKEYEKGNKDALVPIIGDSLQLGVDSIELGIEIGEGLGLELLEGVSAVTGPIGMAIGAAIFVGTDIYMAVRKVEKMNSLQLEVDSIQLGMEIGEGLTLELLEGVSGVTGLIGMAIVGPIFVGTNIYMGVRKVEETDKQIHLTGWEKVHEGWLGFFGLQPSKEIERLIKEKGANNQAVNSTISFFEGNPYIQRYVFPSRRVVEHDWEIILDNVVLLDQKRNDIKWSRTRPDNLEGVNLFCLPKGNWESVPTSGTYYCDGAIGVEYANNRTGNYTLISLGDGKDRVKGFQESKNIFVLGDGHKEMTGGNKDDNFIFGGKSVNASVDREIKGSIDGGGGINTIDVGGLTPHDEGSKGECRCQVSADFRQGILKDASNVALNMSNINQFLGRRGRVDHVVSACGTKYMDGKGGENKNYLDSITIPKDDSCFYDTQVIVNPYTKVANSAINGNFTYFVRGEKGKEAYIDLGPNSQSNNAIVFNYTLQDIAAIDKSEENITFSFIEEFYKREKKINVDSSFNLTVSGADENITTYNLIDSTKIVMGQNNVYAMQNTEESIDSLVKDYSSIAERSQMYVIVHSNGEVLTIGHSNHDILMNDPKARASHLVGGSGENVFVVTPGDEKLTLAKLPISDVIIYDFNRENKIDTLDLRKIQEQLKQDIDSEINTEVSKIDSDLLINLSLDDASKKEVVKIRLKGALENNWYKRVHIVIDSIFVIEDILEDFELTPQPLIFDDNSTTIYVINPKDVVKGNKIRVKKEIGNYTFARDNDALIITNSLSSRADKNNLFTIILNDFYHEYNQDKMQTLKIEFNDKNILLRKEIEWISSAGNFGELQRNVRNDSYKAVMYEIKKQKLFEAIGRNNIDDVKELINHGVSIDATNNEGQTPLHYAAKSDKLEVVKYLIEEKGANINVKDNDGQTPLHYAADHGKLEVVKYLIEEKGANINVKDNDGQTPLHYAADHGKLEVVKYLIEEKGANINVKDNDGQTLLHSAAKTCRLDIVKYLIEEKHVDFNVKNNYGVTPLHYAAKNDGLEVVEYLIEEKTANINVKDGSGMGLLHYAATSNNTKVVRYLTEKKNANINVKNNSGVTPLYYAAMNDGLEVVKYFIEEKGANVNVKDNDGQTPLHYAANSDKLEVVKYFIEEKHIDFNVKNNYGVTPLHDGTHNGTLGVVRYLIEEKNADINVKDNDGQTPLHYSAYDGNLEVVKYLIEKGADVDIRGNDGQTPLHFAAINGKLEVVRYFIEGKNANINVKDNYGETPLHPVATNGNLEIVKYLIEKGADFDIRGNYGLTPLHCAAIDGKLEVVKYLIQKGAKIDLKVNDEVPLEILESSGHRSFADSIIEELTERLFDAVKYDDSGEVQGLINQGVSVKVKDSDGQTLLQCAVNNSKLKVVKYLVEKGADVNVKDNSGTTLLHSAAMTNKLETVKYLVEDKHVDFNVKDNSGVTPLHYAAMNDGLQVVTYFIEEKGANVNVKDNYGITPLFFAAMADKLETVKYLVEKGADVNVKDKNGRTLLYSAAMADKLETVKYLVEEGADVNVKVDSSRTLLHSAAMTGKLEIVKYLVEKGADINVTNDIGQTPLDLATNNRYSGVVEYLKRKYNEKREKHQQRKRRHHHGDRNRHHSSHGPLTIDSSNQPEIATSNASQKSSWINDLVGWVKNSIGGLVGSRAALPEASANYSNTTKNPGNQYASQFSSEVCINNNVGLGFFLLQRFLDKKYPLPKFCSFTYEEALANTLNIVGEFEETLEKTAKQSGVLIKDVNFFKVYLDMADHVWNERYSQIPNTLYSAAKEACPKNEKFLSILKGNIEKMLDRQQTVNSNNQEQGIANVDNKIPPFSLNSIVVEPANNKGLKEVTCAGQVA
ncbi:uncharacterized protein LOC143218247 [Lasioglossum baleicum]|uniref:uncharacterized protein LOC143218247 n=1 Tax=Lasioglossum baleicum TaxID=434251 RepID=UPI003FCC9563